MLDKNKQGPKNGNGPRAGCPGPIGGGCCGPKGGKCVPKGWVKPTGG